MFSQDDYMPLLRALGKLADFVVRTLWVILRAVARSVVGVKRLLAAMHRLRGRGSDGSLATARLFDVHAVTLSADLALLAAWWFSPVEVGRPAGIVALASSMVLAIAAVLAIRQAPGVSRAVIGLGLVLRGLLTVVAAQWLAGHLALLLVLLALVAPQWGVHLVTLRSGAGGRRLAVPLLATAYALLGCLIVVVPALVLGWLNPAGPLWLAAALLTLSALLALRVPSDEPPPRPVSARQRSGHESANADLEPGSGLSQPSPTQPGPTRPGPTRPSPTQPGPTRPGSTGGASPSRQAVPPQPAADGASDGFHVYRPSTLDDA